jgi:SAM-dependent methyltransferase
VPSFDDVADAYDAGRPDYPDEVFASLAPLDDALVLEGGAGTGIASRGLLRGGARVIAFDVGHEMLARARARSPELATVVADGAATPFRDQCADLVCFAQSWHWLDEGLRCHEAARVLRPGGRWAAWWSHARADGEHWFDRAWDLVESSCPGTHRGQRDVDWGAAVERSGRFTVRPRITIEWERTVPVGTWVDDERSKSYIAALPASDRDGVLADIERLVRERFADGVMSVRYETWLWIGERI